MNTSRNSVQLIGYLGNDPETKSLSEGKKVSQVRMATSESYYSNNEWKEETQWHSLVMWGKLAEQAEKQLRKGAYVLVEGKITYRTYEDSKGETRYVTEIRVSGFILLDKKSSEAASKVQEKAQEAKS